ncbi:MAG TPA: DUF488 domain-containing protein, partial [Terriglobia bacterium]|nr:DUF488 domain-containing protein [Terriglobia bacterium]
MSILVNEGSMTMIELKRVYEGRSSSDGKRLLIERLWPRGIKKADLKIDDWIKDAGPSSELRKWFNHDPAKWDGFRQRYFRELDKKPSVWKPILMASEEGTVTLIYSSHDTQHNNAVALAEYLKKKASTR